MKKILFPFLLLVQVQAYAQSFDSDLDMQTEQFLAALNDEEATIFKKKLDLNLIRVRTILEAGIDIPVISKFSIRPEVELFFGRD